MNIANRFSMGFFRIILVMTIALLIFILVEGYHTQADIKNLQPRLFTALEQSISLYPQIYKKQKDLVSYARAMTHLNEVFKKQMQEALSLQNSKEDFARILLITVLILLLLSGLAILRIARSSQDALKELNRTLDEKVKARTTHLSAALNQLHNAHTDLKNAQTQLLQSEKFSAIGQLAAGVAHEINNPIGFINSNLQTLERYVVHYTQLLGILNKLEKYLKDKDQERVAQVVASWEKIRKETNFAFIDDDVASLIKESREGAEKIRRIIIDLRAFASPDKGTMDSVNLEALMESMLNIVWNEIKYKAELRRDYGDVPLIICNPQKIGQVFVNLLTNAAHAIKDRGVITIKTYTKNDFVYVDIIDTGCGISAENVTRVFDPFFTTKTVGQGVGLGLSVGYDIIKKYGGMLSFVTTAGKGTTFTVKLPVAFVYDSAQL